MNKQRKLTTFIFGIFFLIVLMISLLLMYHAKFISTLFANHFEKQLMWIGIGFLVFTFFYFFPKKILFHYSWLFYLLNVVMLMLVLFIGKNVNGAKAWILIGKFQFQPSELMKLSYALYLASFCSNRTFYTLKDEFKFIVKVIILFLLPSILVFFEPDTGAIIFFLLITIVILWNTKISKKWFWLFLFIILGIIGTFFYCYYFERDLLIKLIGTSFFYRIERVLAFGEGMQIENAITALGSAPLISFNLINPGIYIPEAPTDFVFALSSNVLGLFGPILILFCYLILDYCLIDFFKREKNQVKKLFFEAFLTIFIFSQLENIGMNLGLLPIIGIPLPFLSYGGSFMIVLFAFLGIILDQKKSFTKKSKTFHIHYQ